MKIQDVNGFCVVVTQIKCVVEDTDTEHEMRMDEADREEAGALQKPHWGSGIKKIDQASYASGTTFSIE